MTWASGAGRPGAWAARDLEGRPLLDFVHEDDRDELLPGARPGDDGRRRPAPVFRLRTRDGGWRAFETSCAAPRPGLPGLRGPARGREGRVLQLRDVGGRPSAELELRADGLHRLPDRPAQPRPADGGARRGPRPGAPAGEPSCLLLLDLDGFKPVNDIAGHEAGDQLLVRSPTGCARTVRDGDLVSRLGGDEFAVLVRAGAGGGDGASPSGSWPSCASCAPPCRRGDTGGRAGPRRARAASGSPSSTRPTTSPTTIRQRRPRAAHRQGGRQEPGLPAQRRRRQRHRPPRPAGAGPAGGASSRAGCGSSYQPVVGIAERRVLGLEALVRWDHPVLGPVPPDEFIPLAEDDGLIVPLQRFVLRHRRRGAGPAGRRGPRPEGERQRLGAARAGRLPGARRRHGADRGRPARRSG